MCFELIKCTNLLRIMIRRFKRIKQFSSEHVMGGGELIIEEHFKTFLCTL